MSGVQTDDHQPNPNRPPLSYSKIMVLKYLPRDFTHDRIYCAVYGTYLVLSSFRLVWLLAVLHTFPSPSSSLSSCFPKTPFSLFTLSLPSLNTCPFEIHFSTCQKYARQCYQVAINTDCFILCPRGVCHRYGSDGNTCVSPIPVKVREFRPFLISMNLDF